MSKGCNSVTKMWVSAHQGSVNICFICFLLLLADFKKKASVIN